MNAVYQPLGICPCLADGCTVVGTKLTKRGHLVGCVCYPCRNSRNVKKGKRGAAKTHTALQGSGFTPYHEESGRFYDLTTRPEVKNGYPASTVRFYQFLATDFFRRALSQSERSIPVGIDAKPSVSIDGKWLVVDLRSPSPQLHERNE